MNSLDTAAMATLMTSRKFKQWIRRVCRPSAPGLIRRTSPLSTVWGFDRGTPVDRYYIEKFLEEHCQDITGRTLEVADTQYTDQFGRGVTQADVLDIDPSNNEATLIADLSVPDLIPTSLFDCFILTQTLQFIYDTKSAIENAHRLLRPGGVLLATVPCVSPIDSLEMDDCWRFTSSSCRRLFAETFGAENTTVRHYGNMATCIAFLQGMAYEELSDTTLKRVDDAFPLVICIRGVKAK